MNYIPLEYRDLYDLLEAKLIAFAADINDGWNGRKSHTAFAAELLSANGNRGLQLLEPHSQEWLWRELDRLKELGLGAVSIALNYPLLYEPFWEFAGMKQNYQRMTDFYAMLAANIRASGMKLLVDNSVVFTGYYSAESGLSVGDYYKTLTMDDLVEGRAENAIAILENVQPDYLNLGSEPDTQAENLGQDDLNTPAGYGQFIGTIVSAIRDDCTSDTPLGAGVGTWKSNGLDFVERLVDAGVDTIDLHVYPVNYQCLLSRLDDLVILAKSCGKQAAIGEAWLQKRRDSEYTDAGVASTPEIFSRDAFDFWKPLDTQFLTSLVGFSHWRDLAYFSGFWSRYFWAYLEYAACEGMSPDDIIQQSSMAAAMGIKTGHTTDTGKAYRQAVAA